jgi:hypothetical protein
VRATVRHHVRFEVAALIEEGADRLDISIGVEVALGQRGEQFDAIKPIISSALPALPR